MAYVFGLVLLLGAMVPGHGSCVHLVGLLHGSSYDAGGFGPGIVRVGRVGVIGCYFVEP